MGRFDRAVERQRRLPQLLGCRHDLDLRAAEQGFHKAMTTASR